jgi:hypothetical protein
VDRYPPWVLRWHGWSNSTNYYEAERTRNMLRRVCKSWDEYLQQYAHRFVCIEDVVHGNVPTHYLHSALRISLGDHNRRLCDACKFEQLWPESYEPRPPHFWESDGYIELCSRLLKRGQSVKTEIIDYGFSGDYLHIDDLSRIFPNVVRIQAHSVVDATECSKAIESLPLLRHIYTHLDWFGAKFSLKSSSLTTLVLSCDIRHPSFWPLAKERLHLPALRYLQIRRCYGNSTFYEGPAWLPLLKIVGEELRALHLPDEGTDEKEDVPGEIWTLCPKLEDLFIGLRILSTPPPVEHPIHTIDMYHDWGTSCDSLLDRIPDWPGLRTVRFTGRWDSRILPRVRYTINRLNPCLCMEDFYGETFQEFVARSESERR